MSERRLYAIELPSYNHFLLVPREKLSEALDLLEGNIAKKRHEDYKFAGYVRENEPLAIVSVLESEVLAAELRARAGPKE